MAWIAARLAFDIDVRFSDVPLYRTYGESFAGGAVPYRDFQLEYPPGALPVFALPALVSSDLSGFRLALETLLIVCGAAMLVAMDVILARVNTSPARRWAALLLAALTPLALGRVMAERYDLWPAALAVVAVAAAVTGRQRTAGAALGLGAAAKLFPAALLPLLVCWAWRRGGRRDGWRVLLAFTAVLLVCVVPFAAASPSGVSNVLERQVDRPLQLETLGASLLIAVHHVAGLTLGIESSYGSINLGGSKAAAVSAVQSLLLLVVLVAVWLRFAKSRADADALVIGCATVVTTLIVLGKVLSLAISDLGSAARAARARPKGVIASALLAIACVATQLVFPSRYLDLIALDPVPSEHPHRAESPARRVAHRAASCFRHQRAGSRSTQGRPR